MGLFLNNPGSFDGYTLFGTLGTDTAYLIDNDGRLVHSWDEISGNGIELLEDGSLIRGPNQETFGAPQTVTRLDWDGTVMWEFEYSVADRSLHHDIEVLPNGNVLIVSWEIWPSAAAIAAGRNPSLLEEGQLRSFSLIEVEPTGSSGGNIVWEWRSWDHLVQDFDPTKDNFGVVAEHPELIDINFIEFTQSPGGQATWHRANSVDYNEELDQIIVSIRNFSEIWVIDHSTTTEEAASHTGGDSGKGGDLLYRWGNPQAYGAGDQNDQLSFSQHDAQWIEAGLPGEGNILIFNNGRGRTPEPFSTVDEIVPPVDESGNYSLDPGQAYGPTAPTWSYQAPNAPDFYSSFVSSAQRLPNGNTLINAGAQGTFFEVTPSGETVWRYVNPVKRCCGPMTQGDPIPPQIGELGGGNTTFRILRYAPDYPGLQGRELTPQGAIELPKPTPETTVTPTEPPTPTPVTLILVGDANCDGDVNSIDAARILQYSAGLTDLPPCPLNADVNNSGDISSVDATLVLQAVAGLIRFD